MPNSSMTTPVYSTEKMFNQLSIVLSNTTNIHIAEIEIYDMDGANVALLGTPSVTNPAPWGHASNAVDGDTYNIYSTDTNINSIAIARQVNGVAVFTLDLDREYGLSEINKVVFYNRDDDTRWTDASTWATGSVIYLHSSDGSDPDEVGVLTAGLVQEFVITPSPVISVTTRPVNVVVSIIDEVPGAAGFNITYQAQTGGEVTAVTGTTTLEHNITGLVPNATYTFRLYADSGSENTLRGELTATTLPNVATNYDVSDFKDSDGLIDMASLDETTASYLASVLPELLSIGDVVSVSVPTNPSLSTSFVSHGETISLLSVDGLLLPFNASSGPGQTVSLTLSDNTTIVPIAYDEVEGSLTIESANTYGDTLYVDGYELNVFEYYSLTVVSVTEAPSLVVDPRSISVEVFIPKAPVGATRYKITATSLSGIETSIFSDILSLKHNITGLVADTSYTVSLCIDNGFGYFLTEEMTTRTLPNIPANYDIAHLVQDGVIDLRYLPDDTIANISEVMNELFNTGDKVKVSVRHNPHLDTYFIELGGVLNVRDVRNFGVLLPFVESKGSGQRADAVLSDGTTVAIDYDENINGVAVNGVVYSAGDSFVLDGMKVAVTDLGERF